MLLLWLADVDMSGVCICVLGCNRGYSIFRASYVLIYMYLLCAYRLYAAGYVF